MSVLRSKEADIPMNSSFVCMWSLTCVSSEAALGDVIAHYSLVAVDQSLESWEGHRLKGVNVWQLHCIELFCPSSTLLPTHLPSLALLVLFPSHSRFSTAGCCRKAASWRLDVWLPRWLKMLPQDPRENQEVVTSLRGELLPFSFPSRWSELCKGV